jgi:hypothetical protein
LASFGSHRRRKSPASNYVRSQRLPAQSRTLKNSQIKAFCGGQKTSGPRVTEKSDFLLSCFLQLTFLLRGVRHFRRLLWDRFRNTGGDENPNKENDRPDRDPHRPTLFSVTKAVKTHALQRRVYNPKNRESGHAIVRNILPGLGGRTPKYLDHSH